jgi:hypothetical protein
MADPESVDYVSDSSENNSQLNFSLSQQYLSTLSFDEDDNDQSLTSPIRQPTGPSPSLSQLSSLPLSQVLFHDFSSYQFLKPFKKYIPKLLRFHKIQNYLQNSLHGIDQRTTRMTGNHFSINQKVTVNLPRLREEEGIILQVRKSSSPPHSLHFLSSSFLQQEIVTIFKLETRNMYSLVVCSLLTLPPLEQFNKRQYRHLSLSSHPFRT